MRAPRDEARTTRMTRKVQNQLNPWPIPHVADRELFFSTGGYRAGLRCEMRQGGRRYGDRAHDETADRHRRPPFRCTTAKQTKIRSPG